MNVNGLGKISTRCMLCKKTTGNICEFFYLTKQSYIHPECARWFPQIKKNIQEGKTQFISEKKIPSETWLSECSLCLKAEKDPLVKCHHIECKVYSHIKCAINNNLCEKDHDLCFFYCKDHFIKAEKCEVIIDSTIPSKRIKKKDIILNKNPHPATNQKLYLNSHTTIAKPNTNSNNTRDVPSAPKPSSFKQTFSIITTSNKCDICLKQITSSKGVKRCRKCLMQCHIDCEKKYYVGFNYQTLCYKCSRHLYNEHCLVCGFSKGTMSKCLNKVVHCLCLKSFPNLFYISFVNSKDIKKYGLDQRKSGCLRARRCDICERANKYVLSCRCGLEFHPYCAFRANLDIEIAKEEVKFVCNAKHKLYLSSYKHSLNLHKEDESNHSNTTSTGSNQKEKKQKISKIKPKLVKILNKEPKKVSYEKQIHSLNFSFLREKLIKGDLIDPFQINKIEREEDKFCWKLTDPYFIKFTEDEMNTIFNCDKPDADPAVKAPLKDDTTLQMHQPSISLNENENNSEDNSLICKLNYKTEDNSFYFMYCKRKIDKLPSFTPSAKHPVDTNEDSFTLLSRKRGLVDLSDINEVPLSYKGKIRFNKGFTFNSLSKKILEYESQTTYPKNNDEDYVATSLSSKYQMLSLVTKNNKKIIQKILQNYKKKANEVTLEKIQKEKIPVKQKYKSHSNYQKIRTHLLSAMRRKSYEDIISLKPDKSNKGMENKEIACRQFKNDSECCVCLNIDAEDEATTPIVFCDKCNVSFHQSCYGIQRIPSGEYLCNLCVKVLSGKKNIKCSLCRSAFGALKQVEKEKWAHVTCIILSRCYVFRDYSEMSKVIKISSDDYVNHNCCRICESNKGVIKPCKCCGKFYHFFCGYFNGNEIEIKEMKDNRVYYPNGISIDFVFTKCKENSEYLLVGEEQGDIRKIIYQKIPPELK